MAYLDENQHNTTDTMKGPTYSSSSSDFSEKPPVYTYINHIQTEQRFSLEHDGFPWRDVTVNRPDGSVAYFADISEFKPNGPDVSIHSGGKEGVLVGVAHFRWSRSIRAGLGSDLLAMEWVDLKRGGTMTSKRFDFEYRGERYSLRRTSDPKHGVKGMGKVLMANYQIVREGSGEVVGYYTNETMPGRKKGDLCLAEGISRELEILVVLGVVSWREKSRRRATRSAAAAGGGGGGGGS